MKIDTSKLGYRAKFSFQFFLPQYWLIWFGYWIIIVLAYMPRCIRDFFAFVLYKLSAKKLKAPRRRSFINLTQCFPELSDKQKNKIIDNMCLVAFKSILGVGQIKFRRIKTLVKKAEIYGLENFTDAIDQNKNIVLFVPHSWNVDMGGVIINEIAYRKNRDICAMYRPQKNPLVNYLWTRLRTSRRGNAHPRQEGLKSFLNKIRKGYIGYYLPDQDFGPGSGEYASFFNTTKQTLSSLNVVARLGKCEIIPLFNKYDLKTKKYIIEIHKPLKISEDNLEMATLMNQEIESFIKDSPEQYTWFLELLKTRQDGKNIYK
ncbi:MAG: lauroyl-Kdo(2)-lipid IV(A) myristoyltransferase [Psittacicella sp.]